ncbi:hypothetical protein EDD21DRAFT_388200 [Dissophora ornata]|nr:hypothetical protein EDD21DRAFT_388200 [Dissophora ornata]
MAIDTMQPNKQLNLEDSIPSTRPQQPPPPPKEGSFQSLDHKPRTRVLLSCVRLSDSSDDAVIPGSNFSLHSRRMIHQTPGSTKGSRTRSVYANILSMPGLLTCIAQHLHDHSRTNEHAGTQTRTECIETPRSASYLHPLFSPLGMFCHAIVSASTHPLCFLFSFFLLFQL